MQHPHDRQILVSFGNRYVVFGSGVSLPNRHLLGPEDVKQVYARVADEREGVERRIVESLVVDGFEVKRVTSTGFGDVAVVDKDGQSALVEIKTGDRDFAGVNLNQAWAELTEAAENGERREIWGFNLERLGLGIVWSEGTFAPGFVQLPALNVWTFNQDGTTFLRQDVVDAIDEWSRRIGELYTEVEAWARAKGFDVTRNRTIPISEEMMQSFAVPDREVPILDISSGSDPVASLVPVGLWVIGLSGQINIITRNGTFKLGDKGHFPNPPEWMLINPRDRSIIRWAPDELTSILGFVSAHE